MPLVPLWKKNIWMTLSIYINSDHVFSDYGSQPNWKIQLQNNDIQAVKKAMMNITVSHFYFP